MKIVINKCYGGFGVSPKALIQLIEKGSEGVEKYTEKEYFGEDESKIKEELKDYSKDYGSGYFGEKTLFVGTLYKDGFLYSFHGDRTDPVLIEVVENLKEGANNRFSELKIVEIPDDVEWQIDEYDGIEWIAEKHRTWA